MTLVPLFLDRAKAHLESGLYFDPPHDRAFRLEQSELAKPLFQRFGVQEMDFGWWDEPEQTMNLLEVKDYSRGGFNEEHYVNECIQKATDCLLLLASIWYSLPYGQKIKDCLPEEWHARPAPPPRLHLFFVIKEPPSNAPRLIEDPVGMDALQSRARNKIRGRIELLQVTPATTLFLMNHRAAAARRLPIKTDEEVVAPAPALTRSRRR